MRTTIRLDDDLLTAARQFALDTNRTLTTVIEDALRQYLNNKKAIKEKEPVKLHTFKGKGLQPGVDLDDSAALLDLMEEYDGAF